MKLKPDARSNSAMPNNFSRFLHNKNGTVSMFPMFMITQFHGSSISIKLSIYNYLTKYLRFEYKYYIEHVF